jgi:uncharacterized membrane protein YbhN (UPF0104 family)
LHEPRRRLALALRLAAIGLVAGLLWLFAHRLEWGKLADALRGATLWPLALAAALNFVCLWGKAVCWRILLAPRFHVKIARLFRYTVAAFATSVIAPARAGEVVRVWTLKRRDGVPVADSAAVAVAEKLLDGVSMLLLVAPLPWLLPDLPAWVGEVILACAAIALTLLVALYIAVGRIDGGAGTSWLRRFIAGMHVVRSPKRLVASLATLIGVWAADFAMVNLVLYAVGIRVPIASGLLILFTLNLTIAVPSTPAQIGALEVGAIAATDLLGIPREPAFAFALLYHALQVLPLLAAGLALELPLVLGRERHLPGDAAEPATTSALAATSSGCPAATEQNARARS